MNIRPPPWLLASWGAAALLTLGLALNASPWLRGDLDWRWRHLVSLLPERAAPVGLLLAAYVVTAGWLWRWAQHDTRSRRAWAAVVFAVLSAAPLQLSVQALTAPDPLSPIWLRTTSAFLGGYHDVAISLESAGQFLRQFPTLAPGFLPHPQRHPPGLILYFVGVEWVLEQFPAAAAGIARAAHLYRCDYWPLLYAPDAKFAAAAGGLLSIGLNALALIPLYLAGRGLIGERTALAGVLLSPLLPGYVLWAGIWDQAFVLVTVIVLWLLHRAFALRRHGAWWLAGLVLSVGTFFTHALLTLIGFVAFFAALQVWAERQYWWANRGQLLLNAFGFWLGLASVWLGYWLAFGVSFLDVYRATTADHYAMSTHYVSRLFYNPYDFVLFLGYTLGPLALVAAWQAARARAARQPLTPAHVLVLASALTVLTLTVLGVSRGEVGRVWAFLMPLAVLSACAAEGGPAHSSGRWLVTGTLLAAQVVVMQSVLELTERGPVHAYAVPPSARSAGARLGEGLELAGFELSAERATPAGTLSLTLYFRALGPQASDYTVFVHLYDSVLGMAAQQDSPPRQGQYPTTCWRPGEVVAHEVALTLRPDAAPGDYQLLTGMYDPAEGSARLATDGPGAVDATIVLGEVRVEP